MDLVELCAPSCRAQDTAATEKGLDLGFAPSEAGDVSVAHFVARRHGPDRHATHGR